jgi:glycosyltransferase involved in cell wall biosynthesis
MNIIYIVNIRIPTEKAHGYQIVRMCEEFAMAGCKVELWAPERENLINKDLFEFYGVKKNFIFKKIKSFDFLKYDKILGSLALYGQWLFFIAKLFFIKIDKNVLIYTRDQGVAWVFGRRGFKVCYEGHGWFTKKTRLNIFLLKKANFFVFTNNFIKNEFVKKGFSENKILVSPNGIDLNTFDIQITKKDAQSKLNLEKITENKKILLYTGSFKTMGFEKGISDILKAIKKLDDKNILFLAVGGNEEAINYYKKIAKDFCVDNQSIFFSRQSQLQLALFQKAADVLLMPFPKIAHYEYFMTPLKMFEYMAAKRPIIASDLPSIREILNDRNCFFCEPGNFEDLAKKIKQVLEDTILAEKLSRQAHQDVVQYAWDKRAQRILNFIMKI